MERLRDTKAVLADWDDTKVSTFHSVAELYTGFARSEQLQIPTVEDIIPHWGKPIKKIIGGVWLDMDPEHLKSRFWGYFDQTDFTITPFTGTRDTIFKLKEMGFVLGIVSSSARRVIDKTLERYLHLPPDTYAFIQSSEDTDVHKPDPRVFDPAFERLNELGISEEQTIYVGDGLNDMEAATSRGILFVAVTTGLTTAEEFMDRGVVKDLILVSFNELPSLLNSAKS